MEARRIARSGKCGFVGCSISLLDQTFLTKQAASTSHQRGAKPRPMLDRSAGRPSLRSSPSSSGHLCRSNLWVK